MIRSNVLLVLAGLVAAPGIELPKSMRLRADRVIE